MLNFVKPLQAAIRKALGIEPPKPRQPMNIDLGVVHRLLQELAHKPEPVRYDIHPPELPKNVVPQGQKSAIAMDSVSFDYASEYFQGQGFMGYSVLSMMAVRSEYRAAVEVIANECTRKWIELKSTATDVDLSDKIAKLHEEMERLNLRDVFRTALEHDGFFGRGQIYINIDNCLPEKRNLPLVISDKTIKQGSLKGFANIEPIWTTPQNYDTVDPTDFAFYNPQAWWVLGTNTHSDRLLTIVSREVPDMLKAAYNFGGLSLIQIMQPYVERWWRTVEAVANLVNNYSTSGIKTDMGSILQSGYESDETAVSAAGTLLNRIKMFVETRDNRGMMILDKELEEFFQFNVPLGGLDGLLAKAQEQMCMPCHIPLVKYTGITPSGLNASSEGEIKVFYDWIHSEQENNLRQPLTKILQIMQLSLFGEIDNSITFDFCPLEEMTELELANVRETNQRIDTGYIEAGVLAPEESRARLRTDKNSGYQNLTDEAPELPGAEPDAEEKAAMDLAMDADKWITVHPNGKGEKGQPALIDGEGTVKAGMGGKFNGKNIKDAHGTKKFTSGETNAETEKRHSDNPKKYLLDKENNPLVFYHGTNKDFHEFKNDKDVDKIDSGDLGDGVYLTNKKEKASSFATMRESKDGSVVYKTVVKSNNPLYAMPGDKVDKKIIDYLNNKKQKEMDKLADKEIKEFNNDKSNQLWFDEDEMNQERKKIKESYKIKQINSDITYSELKRLPNADAKLLSEAIKSMGHDSLVYNDGDEVVVFDPSDVEMAVNATKKHLYKDENVGNIPPNSTETKGNEMNAPIKNNPKTQALVKNSLQSRFKDKWNLFTHVMTNSDWIKKTREESVQSNGIESEKARTTINDSSYIVKAIIDGLKANDIELPVRPKYLGSEDQPKIDAYNKEVFDIVKKGLKSFMESDVSDDVVKKLNSSASLSEFLATVLSHAPTEPVTVSPNSNIFSKLPENTSLKSEFTEKELTDVVQNYKKLRDVNRLKAIDFVSKVEKQKGFNTEQKTDLASLLESEYSNHSKEKNQLQENDKKENQAIIKDKANKILDKVLSSEKSKAKINEKFNGNADAYKESRIKNAESASKAKWNDGNIEGSESEIKKFLYFLEN